MVQWQYHYCGVEGLLSGLGISRMHCSLLWLGLVVHSVPFSVRLKELSGINEAHLVGDGIWNDT